MKLFQKGDEAAFTALYYKHWEQIRTTINSIINYSEVAKELAQETFTRVFVHRDSFRGGSFKAWVSEIARNVARDYLRAEERRQPREVPSYNSKGRDILEPLSGKETPLNDIIKKDLFDFIDRELYEILIENQRTEEDKYIGLLKKRAFILYEWFDYTLSEVYDKICKDAQTKNINITYDALENWLSRRDILEDLLWHLFEEHENDISDRIHEAITPGLLNEQECKLYNLSKAKLSVNEISERTEIPVQEIRDRLESLLEKIFNRMFKQSKQILSRRQRK